MALVIQILTMLPALITAIHAAEQAIQPKEGEPHVPMGAARLDLIIGIVEDTMGVVAGMSPALAKVISRIVGTFNALGIFKTTGAASGTASGTANPPA